MWRPIKDYEQYYEVSNDGQVRSLGGRRGASKRILKQTTDRRGYKRVDLCVNQKRSTRQVHRLVAQAFTSNPNELPQVNHIDGNPSNNMVVNLEWCDHQGNMTHAWSTGLITHKGELHTQRKLSAEEVRYIRAVRVRGWIKAQKLAYKFNVSPAAIDDIWRGRTWRSL